MKITVKFRTNASGRGYFMARGGGRQLSDETDHSRNAEAQKAALARRLAQNAGYDRAEEISPGVYRAEGIHPARKVTLVFPTCRRAEEFASGMREMGFTPDLAHYLADVEVVR